MELWTLFVDNKGIVDAKWFLKLFNFFFIEVEISNTIPGNGGNETNNVIYPTYCNDHSSGGALNFECEEKTYVPKVLLKDQDGMF